MLLKTLPQATKDATKSHHHPNPSRKWKKNNNNNKNKNWDECILFILILKKHRENTKKRRSKANEFSIIEKQTVIEQK